MQVVSLLIFKELSSSQINQFWRQKFIKMASKYILAPQFQETVDFGAANSIFFRSQLVDI